MRVARLCIAAFVLAGAACPALVACVGDATAHDSGTDASSGDAATEACAVLSSQPGVDCFSGGRCALATQQCCVGLTGQGLVGQCTDASTCGVATDPYEETWGCDKGFDCPATTPKCCAGAEATQTLFGSLGSGGGCPLQLHVSIDASADAQPPPPFTIASCQTSCPGPQFCSTDAECGDGGLRCVAASFTQSSFSKPFGVCLP